MTSTSVREAREALIRTHFESETAQDFDVTLATMSHPRYEIVPTGEVFDGPEEVMAYYHRSREAFPDQRHDNVRLRHADDAVIAEFDLLGTHLGELYGIPPTGRAFRCPMVAFFLFDGPEGDRIICERVYFDIATIATQLGVMPGPVGTGPVGAGS
ncbi:ester cyclase [Actinoallomurus rhizosphaericola]|uniref:ester cyclase n=1 Tax=Actinoallomurus rhizosphaericola TaxID=2952536 RepID=UPI002092BE33|nr:ester cyclase [Actinoallomurus rhizosphaericola]MCO5997975.1 ester cyclase [Actinoallomurus rhizosphaericola]